MKTISISGLLGLMLLLALPFAVAQESASENVSNASTNVSESDVEKELSTDPGITPDSPLWGIDVALDKLAFRLASGPKKAEIGLNIARERLAEIKRLDERNKTQFIEKAMAEHEGILAELKDTIDKMNATENMSGIERGMANHIAALTKVEQKIAENPNIPPEVKAKLETKINALKEKAILVETKVIEKRIEKIENKTLGFEKREQERENKTKNQSQEQERGRNRSTEQDRNRTGEHGPNKSNP